MNGMEKNTKDDIDIYYRRYDYDLNEKKLNENNINNFIEKINICECINKLNIFGKRKEKSIKYNK